MEGLRTKPPMSIQHICPHFTILTRTHMNHQSSLMLYLLLADSKGVTPDAKRKLTQEFSLHLPWRQPACILGHWPLHSRVKDPPDLSDNKVLAERRLQHLGNKLKCNPSPRANYTENVNAYLSKGFAMKIPADTNYAILKWHLPHHTVFRHRKGWVRMGFDWSAKNKEVCLNTPLLQGSVLCCNLLRLRGCF